MSFYDGKFSYGPPRGLETMISLKVDNLTFRTTPDDLLPIFERYGRVGDIYIPRDRYSKESRGFAFVRYFDRLDAEDAMDRLDGFKVDGREIRVQVARYARPRDSIFYAGRSRLSSYQSNSHRKRRRSDSFSPSRHRHRSRSRSYYKSRYKNRSKYSRSRTNSQSPRRSRDNSRTISKSSSRSRSSSYSTDSAKFPNTNTDCTLSNTDNIPPDHNLVTSKYHTSSPDKSSKEMDTTNHKDGSNINNDLSQTYNSGKINDSNYDKSNSTKYTSSIRNSPQSTDS